MKKLMIFTLLLFMALKISACKTINNVAQILQRIDER